MDEAAQMVAAYQIGRLECAAAQNLLKAVTRSTRNQLKELVRPGDKRVEYEVQIRTHHQISSNMKLIFCIDIRIWGQPKFILHDGIAAGVFNIDYSGASGGFAPWDRALCNSQEIVDLMMQRMQKDFETLAPKMRKPWGQSQLDS